MADSTILNLDLMTTGSNSGTWGTVTNENLQKAIADKNNSYVIISKIKSGNVPIKPIPLNAVTIRDRFRKEIGLVTYL